MRMNVPKLRFKADDGTEFSEWEEKKIGDLIEIYDEKVNSDCELPILTSSKKYGIQYQNDHFGREQLHDISGYNVLPYGYCTYRNRSDGTDFTFNINTLCKRGIVSKFYPVFTSKTTDLYVLASLLNNEKSTVKKIAYTAKGTGQKVLSISDLQNINVRIPCVAEQKKIASFLSTIDEIIQSTESELNAWQERKKGVMQKIFNREVRFKADDGSEFPEWEEKRLGEVCDIVGGGTPDTEKAEYWGGDVNWFTPSEIGETKYVVKSNRQISKLGLLKSSAKLLPQGTILLTSRATLGEMAIVKQECCTNQGFQSLIVKQECLNEFIYYYQPIIKRYCEKHASGSTFLEISKKEISGCKLGVPSLPEQRKIAECLSSLDDVINQIDAELSAWKEFKKGLLQQMFV